jgi:hypothetical protein
MAHRHNHANLLLEFSCFCSPNRRDLSEGVHPRDAE